MQVTYKTYTVASLTIDVRYSTQRKRHPWPFKLLLFRIRFLALLQEQDLQVEVWLNIGNNFPLDARLCLIGPNLDYFLVLRLPLRPNRRIIDRAPWLNLSDLQIDRQLWMYS